MYFGTEGAYDTQVRELKDKNPNGSPQYVETLRQLDTKGQWFSAKVEGVLLYTGQAALFYVTWTSDSYSCPPAPF